MTCTLMTIMSVNNAMQHAEHVKMVNPVLNVLMACSLMTTMSVNNVKQHVEHAKMVNHVLHALIIIRC